MTVGNFVKSVLSLELTSPFRHESLRQDMYIFLKIIAFVCSPNARLGLH